MSGPGIIRRTALRAAAPVLKRWYAWWNGRERQVRVDGLDFVVLPGVFPPHLFFSTHLLAEHVRTRPLQGRTFLDLGTGSGRIALTAARAGGIVTACDLNPAAVACATNNAARNNLRIITVLSDQFDALPDHFDVIAINPPYYDRDPATPSEHAFLAGEGLLYFQRLFPVLADRIRQGSEVFVVLSEDLDLERIRAIARESALGMDAIRSARRWAETSTVFMIRRLTDARSSPTGS
ncbi:MAG: class I SAM-dependent methyltransferase [Flavobacteriales bacterium]|nr:class I SAM-dependent methyltransferase [Flavobacteriales bacterium]